MAGLHINAGWNFKWTNEEDEIIRKYYPKNGANAVHEILPNRELKSIQQRAFKLGVKYLQYNKEFFDKIDTIEKAYWLGFLYADGYVTHDNRWGVELGYEDYNHLQNLLNAFGYNGDLKTRERNGVVSCSFTINNKQMTSSLISNGVVPNKTCCLEFPNIDIVSKNLLSHFIRGFFDGDGCVYLTRNKRPRKDRGNKIYERICKGINFVCKSESFTNDLIRILNDNGINLRCTINKRDNLYTITTSAIDEIEKFYNYIYQDSNPNIRLERKFNKFNEIFNATANSDVSAKIS